MHVKLTKTALGLYQLTAPVSRTEFITLALSLLEGQLKGPLLNKTDTVGKYLQLRLSNPEHESTAALFLDANMHLVHFAILQHGTLNASTAYPRELAKPALKHHATAVIFSHNHPAGDLTPSTTDIELTFALHSALAVLDITLLDHFIVSPDGYLSFAEAGLL